MDDIPLLDEPPAGIPFTIVDWLDEDGNPTDDLNQLHEYLCQYDDGTQFKLDCEAFFFGTVIEAPVN